MMSVEIYFFFSFCSDFSFLLIRKKDFPKQLIINNYRIAH